MVTVSVNRSTAITDLIVTRAVSAIAELLVLLRYSLVSLLIIYCAIIMCYKNLTSHNDIYFKSSIFQKWRSIVWFTVLFSLSYIHCIVPDVEWMNEYDYNSSQQVFVRSRPAFHRVDGAKELRTNLDVRVFTSLLVDWWRREWNSVRQPVDVVSD